MSPDKWWFSARGWKVPTRASHLLGGLEGDQAEPGRSMVTTSPWELLGLQSLHFVFEEDTVLYLWEK